MRVAFVPSSRELVEEAERASIFAELVQRLNRAADARGLKLTIPFACYDCRRKAD
jgi:hypothetical protein